MRNPKAIRLRPSQGGSMARSVGPDDETRALIAASDALVLDVKSRRSREGSAYITARSQAVKAGQWYDTGAAHLTVIGACEPNEFFACEVYSRCGEMISPNEPFSAKDLSTYRRMTKDECRLVEHAIYGRGIGYNEFDFI